MQNQQLQAGYTVPWGEFTSLKNHFLVSWVAISVLSLYLLESIGNKQVSNVPHFFGAPTQQQHSSPALQRSPAQAASQTRARQGRLAVCLTVHIYCSWQSRHWLWSLSYTGPEYFLSVSLEQIKLMAYKARRSK